jgi:DNA mismatch repair protein MutS2
MHALRVLEYPEVTSRLAAFADTDPGRMLARALQPSFEPSAAVRLLRQTEEADALLGRGPVSLSGFADIGPVALHCQKGGWASGADLHAVGASLAVARQAAAPVLADQGAFAELALLARRIPSFPKLEAKLLGWLDGDGTVRDEASPELAAARARQRRAAARIAERLRSYLAGKTRDYLSDPVITQRSGRSVLPLKAENRGKIKGIVHDTSASGGTLFIEPEDVVALGNELRAAEAREAALVEEVLRGLSEEVGAVADAVMDGAEAAAELDLVLAKARYGHEYRGCIPDLPGSPGIRLERAWHPLLDRESAVPMSLEFDSRTRVLLVTGPNTGGKTVALKTLGLAVLMAQSGMMPAASSMAFSPVPQVWADVGDEQSLSQSLSTFSGHVKNIAEALRAIEPGALAILDELGAGTDPAEGAGLARAILLEFARQGAWVMASTHFGELKVLASETEGFLNCSMEFDQETLRPTYRLLLGVPGASHALAVARRYGIPDHVVEQAEEYLGVSELDLARTIGRLAEEQAKVEAAREEAADLAARLAEANQRAEAAAQSADAARKRMRAEAADEIAGLLREIRLEAQAVFDELRTKPDAEGKEKARTKLKALQEVGSEFVAEVRPVPQAPAALAEGDSVRIRGHAALGTVVEPPRNGKATVAVGRVRMTVSVHELERAGPAAAPKPAKRSGGAMALRSAMASSPELHLRQQRAEDAAEALDRYLDEAVLAGHTTVRIVHGKGEGVLRKLTQDALRRHRAVRSFRLAAADEGGDGVTVVELR